MAPATVKVEIKAWTEQNPLRAWRKSQTAGKVTLMEAASTLGVNMLTIQLWENGSNRPNDDNFLKLGRLLGVDQDVIVALWDHWYSQRPQA
jgi:transcriptional regulator with XRE-family HTH domain